MTPQFEIDPRFYTASAKTRRWVLPRKLSGSGRTRQHVEVVMGGGTRRRQQSGDFESENTRTGPARSGLVLSDSKRPRSSSRSDAHRPSQTILSFHRLGARLRAQLADGRRRVPAM